MMKLDQMAFMLAIITLISSTEIAAASPHVTAMFAFGDSLTDPGNNNFLEYSFAKANFVPYGIDFAGGLPSGRFCNGKTFIDYLGELLGLPVLPPYASPFTTGKSIARGVNYASAGGGILEETGRNLGDRFSLSEQVVNFEDTLRELRSQMGDQELSNYLAKALVIMSLGSNDYVNNYLQPSFYASSYFYNPKDYADLLINHYTRQILALQSLGLRKFVLGGIGPLGCIPNQLAKGVAPPEKCVVEPNNMVVIFNKGLESLVYDLNNKYKNGSVFTYGDTFGAFTDIINNAKSYGFNVTDRGCCGIGRNRGQITCLPFSVPCNERNEYVFWDAFHPTQATNRILAQRAYSGSKADCRPFNVQQMALM